MMQPTSSQSEQTSPAHLLAHPHLLTDTDLAALHGFGGLHGGLALALLTGHLADERPLRSSTRAMSSTAVARTSPLIAGARRCI
jgi:hypothetical protein